MDFLVTARRSPEAYEFEGNAWEFFESAYYLYSRNFRDIYDLIFMPMEAWYDLLDELVEGNVENLRFYPRLYIENPLLPLSAMWFSSEIRKRIESLLPSAFTISLDGKWRQYAAEYADIYCRRYSSYVVSVMMHQVLYVYRQDRITMQFINEDKKELEHIGALKREDLENIYDIDVLIRQIVKVFCEFFKERL